MGRVRYGPGQGGRFLYLLLLFATPWKLGAQDQWFSSAVDPTPASSACLFDMSMDSRGAPVVAFVREGACPGAYLSTWSMDHWETEGVSAHCLPTLTCDGTAIGLALDSQDRPHVILGTDLAGAQYSLRTGAGWVGTTLSTYAVPSAVALDRADNPHVILVSTEIPYQDSLFLAKKTSGQWTFTNMGLWLSPSRPHMVVVDSAGSVYLGARDIITRVGVWKGVNGVFTKIFSALALNQGKEANRSIAVALDSQERLNLAFLTRAIDTTLAYAQSPGFALKEIPLQLINGYSPNLVVASGDIPHMLAGTGYDISYGIWNGVSFSTESFQFGVYANYKQFDLTLGKEDHPYILSRDYIQSDPFNLYLKIFAKLPVPAVAAADERTTSTITWSWSASSSPVVTGYRVRRGSDGEDLSGILSPTVHRWVMGGMGPNEAGNVFLETLYPGYVLPSPAVVAHSSAFPPRSLTLSRSGSGNLSAAWSSNGNPVGTSYRLDFYSPDGDVISAQAGSPTFVYPLLSPLRPYALNVTALSGDGQGAPLCSVDSVTLDSHQIGMAFSFEDLTVEVALSPAGNFPNPVLAAGPLSDFPTIGLPSLIPSGRGFQVEMDHSLPEGQGGTVSVTYPPGWLDGRLTTPTVLARYDGPHKSWVPLPTQQDGGRLTAKVDGFGIFQVMGRRGELSENGGAAAYPNPFRLSEGGRVAVRDVPTGGHVRIMTLSGRGILSIPGTETGIVEWDGKDSSGEEVKSGVYLLLIEGTGEPTKLKLIVER